MKTRQAQEIVRRAKAIGYASSYVGWNFQGKCASIGHTKGDPYRKYFSHYESAIEWLEMMEEPEPQNS